jgi:hypothetical protein
LRYALSSLKGHDLPDATWARCARAAARVSRPPLYRVCVYVCVPPWAAIVFTASIHGRNDVPERALRLGQGVLWEMGQTSRRK